MKSSPSDLPFDVDPSERGGSRVFEMLTSFASQKSNASLLRLDKLLGSALTEEVEALSSAGVGITFIALLVAVEGELGCEKLDTDVWLVSVTSLDQCLWMTLRFTYVLQMAAIAASRSRWMNISSKYGPMKGASSYNLKNL